MTNPTSDEQHSHGAAFVGLHSHDGGAPHWHDEFGEHLAEDLTEEEFAARQLDWRMHNVQLVTVGIDIGSATSHLMFSKILLQLVGEDRDVHSVVVGREILWQSPIMMTPYLEDGSIDAGALRELVALSYLAVDATDLDIDSGAIILTGEALKRENARTLVEVLATQTGKFVCATAGHHLEAVLAANGSGTVARSRRDERTLLNVDIGGGTTKFAIVRDGEILATAAVAVGARQLVKDESRRLLRIDEPVRQTAASLGIDLRLGEVLADKDEASIVSAWTKVLAGIVAGRAPDALTRSLMLTDPLVRDVAPQALTFSGGVSEYIYSRESRDLGDLGLPLAAAIRRALGNGQITLPSIIDPNLGIRATAVGASLFTVQVGINLFISDEAMLPLANVPVLVPRLDASHSLSIEAVSDAIRDALVRSDLEEGEQPVALALFWPEDEESLDLATLARGIQAALPRTIDEAVPLVLTTNLPISRELGSMLKHDVGIPGDVLAVEGVSAAEFDFLDVAPIVHPSEVVPITIKSLLFAGGLDRRSVKLALQDALQAQRAR
ncbi:MAG: ethanolamine ammonia-lyase reactivating factor EutA [Dehalococcoidia bacterium]